MDETAYMRAALKQAEAAARKGEVPVGAVVVKDGVIVARGHNLRESKKDPTAHAEMLAMQRAAKKLGGWRLTGCTLYVTLEPCPMCAGAAINARIERIVYGASDPKAGCCASLYTLPEDARFNHRCQVEGGLLAEQAQTQLRMFFQSRRKKKSTITRRINNMKTIINTEKAPAAIGPYSQATQAQGMVFVSGQLGIDPATGELKDGIRAQTEQSLENVKAILAQAGLSCDDVLKTTVLLADMADFAVVNEIYGQYFTKDCPARACFQVAGLPKGGLVEIECIAAK